MDGIEAVPAGYVRNRFMDGIPMEAIHRESYLRWVVTEPYPGGTGRRPFPTLDDYGTTRRVFPRAQTKKRRKMTARVRKAKKPMTSVTVVRMMLEDWAGSRPIRFIKMGMEAPDRPAKIRLRSMPKPMKFFQDHLDHIVDFEPNGWGKVEAISLHILRFHADDDGLRNLT